MALIRLIYQSTLTNDHEPTLASILRSGRRNNSGNHITGLVLVAERHVLGLLEGERDIVNQTFQRIAADPRHHITGVLSKETIERRYFSKWNAGFRLKDVASHNVPTWKDGFIFDGADTFDVHQAPIDVKRFIDDFAQRHAVGN